MTKDEQSQKLTEESCADFVDRIQLEALNRRWASLVIGRYGRSRQRGIQSPETQAAQIARPALKPRQNPAEYFSRQGEGRPGSVFAVPGLTVSARLFLAAASSPFRLDALVRHILFRS
jgi:hypothetical protein